VEVAEATDEWVAFDFGNLLLSVEVVDPLENLPTLVVTVGEIASTGYLFLLDWVVAWTNQHPEASLLRPTSFLNCFFYAPDSAKMAINCLRACSLFLMMLHLLMELLIRLMVILSYSLEVPLLRVRLNHASSVWIFLGCSRRQFQKCYY
jgi:hypothetical protein